MAVSEKEYKALKRKADEARQARDKAAGQLDAAMERLQVSFGCKTLEDAKRKAAELEREADKAEAAYSKAVKVFEEEWDEYLQEA